MSHSKIPDSYPPEIINHLPESIINLADIVGLNNAIALVNHFGGTLLSLLSFATKSKHALLASIIGSESLQACQQRYGGEWITIPSCTLTKVWLKNHLIFEDMRRGGSLAELATKHGCSENWIVKLRKRKRKPAIESPLHNQ